MEVRLLEMEIAGAWRPQRGFRDFLFEDSAKSFSRIFIALGSLLY